MFSSRINCGSFKFGIKNSRKIPVMYLRWIIGIIIFTNTVEGQIRPCCLGNNVITHKKCEEGILSENLPCEDKFLLRKDEVDEVDEKAGTIRNGMILVEQNKFCSTNINQSDYFIVCYDGEEPSNIFVILGFISAFFLLLTIAIYMSLPKLLDMQGVCIIHSILGLACGFIILGINQMSEEVSNVICQFYAYSLYFSFLYTFFWLNTYCFHLWRTTIQPEILVNIKSWMKFYYIYSCGFPVLLLSVVFFSQYSDIYLYIHPRMAEESICWFGTLEASFVYLYVPISILLSLNILFFFLTIYTLWKEVHKFDGKTAKIIKYRLSLCIKMFFVMGISWIFEVLSAALENTHPSILWRISDTINALQGVLIFLVMVVFRKRVYRLVSETRYGKILPSTWKSISGEDEEFSDTDEDYKLDRVNST